MGCKGTWSKQNRFILSFEVAVFIKLSISRLWRAYVNFVAGGVKNGL